MNAWFQKQFCVERGVRLAWVIRTLLTPTKASVHCFLPTLGELKYTLCICILKWTWWGLRTACGNIYTHINGSISSPDFYVPLNETDLMTHKTRRSSYSLVCSSMALTCYSNMVHLKIPRQLNMILIEDMWKYREMLFNMV